MNLFEFFHEAAYRYLGRRHLTPQEQAGMPATIRLLNKGHGGSAPIDYSDPLTRLAYMFSYAPKHAIIWREYHLRRTSTASASFAINALGTACGPEIVGTLEGIAWSGPGTMTCYSLDTECGWQPMLDAVVAEYNSRKGNIVQCHHGGLKRGKYTLGSLVLSEVVKQGAHRAFKTDMTREIGPAQGLFLDIVKCRLPDRSEPYLSRVFGFGFYNFTKERLLVKDVINNEMNALQPCHCKLPLLAEPKMNFFFPNFR